MTDLIPVDVNHVIDPWGYVWQRAKTPDLWVALKPGYSWYSESLSTQQLVNQYSPLIPLLLGTKITKPVPPPVFGDLITSVEQLDAAEVGTQITSRGGWTYVKCYKCGTSETAVWQTKDYDLEQDHLPAKELVGHGCRVTWPLPEEDK